jgi:hypothetical protein
MASNNQLPTATPTSNIVSNDQPPAIINMHHSYAKCDSSPYIIKSAIYGIFHTLMAFVAVYLSYKCNNNSFNTGSFLLALFFPYMYIMYILATRGTCDIPVVKK